MRAQATTSPTASSPWCADMDRLTPKNKMVETLRATSVKRVHSDTTYHSGLMYVPRQVDVRDVALAHVLCIEKPDANGQREGGGEPI